MTLKRFTQNNRQSIYVGASLFACVILLLAACKPTAPANGVIDHEGVEAARKALALQHPELLPRAQPSQPTTEAEKLKAKRELAALYAKLDAKLASDVPNTMWTPPPETDMAITAAARDAQIEKTGCTADFCRYAFIMHSEAPKEFAKRLGVEGAVLFRYSTDATNTLTAYVFRPGADLQSL